MDKPEARIFIDRSFINVIALRAQTISFAKLLSSISVCVIVSLYRCCETNFFSRREFAIKIIFIRNWTTMHDETGCKKLLDKYNADPLLLRVSE